MGPHFEKATYAFIQDEIKENTVYNKEEIKEKLRKCIKHYSLTFEEHQLERTLKTTQSN